MNQYLKIFLSVMLLALIIIQFIPVDHSVPEARLTDDQHELLTAFFEQLVVPRLE